MDAPSQSQSAAPTAGAPVLGPNLLESKSRVTNITRFMTASAADQQAIVAYVSEHGEQLKRAIGAPAFLNAILTAVTNEDLIQPLKTILRSTSSSVLTGHLTFSKDLLSVSLRDEQDARHGSLQFNYPRKELYRFADGPFYAASNAVEVQAGEAIRRLRSLVDRWTQAGGRSLNSEERTLVGTELASAAGIPNAQKAWLHIGKPTSLCFDYDGLPVPINRVVTEITLAGKQATNLYSIASFVVVEGRQNPLTQLFRAPNNG